jgi:hypothetical protein
LWFGCFLTALSHVKSETSPSGGVLIFFQLGRHSFLFCACCFQAPTPIHLTINQLSLHG